jgi:hypothetical protein
VNPAELAMLDQVDAACRDARLAADPGISEAFTAWLRGSLRASGRAATCPHLFPPRVLAVARIQRKVVLFCPGCLAALIALAGASDGRRCDCCGRQDRRRWRTPVSVTAAIGLALARVTLCAYCAFDLYIDPDPVPGGHLQKGSSTP